MTPEHVAAYINASVVRALIRAMGMHAENMQRLYRNESIAYSAEDFNRLIDEEGIGEDSVIFRINNGVIANDLERQRDCRA